MNLASAVLEPSGPETNISLCGLDASSALRVQPCLRALARPVPPPQISSPWSFQGAPQAGLEVTSSEALSARSGLWLRHPFFSGPVLVSMT